MQPETRGMAAQEMLTRRSRRMSKCAILWHTPFLDTHTPQFSGHAYSTSDCRWQTLADILPVCPHVQGVQVPLHGRALLSAILCLIRQTHCLLMACWDAAHYPRTELEQCLHAIPVSGGWYGTADHVHPSSIPHVCKRLSPTKLCGEVAGAS